MNLLRRLFGRKQRPVGFVKFKGTVNGKPTTLTIDIVDPLTLAIFTGYVGTTWSVEHVGTDTHREVSNEQD